MKFLVFELSLLFLLIVSQSSTLGDEEEKFQGPPLTNAQVDVNMKKETTVLVEDADTLPMAAMTVSEKSGFGGGRVGGSFGGSRGGGSFGGSRGSGSSFGGSRGSGGRGAGARRGFKGGGRGRPFIGGGSGGHNRYHDDDKNSHHRHNGAAATSSNAFVGLALSLFSLALGMCLFYV